MFAAQGGHDLCALTLLEADATIDATNVGGFTALMIAAIRGEIGIMRLLIKNGADPGRATEKGLTAMDLARTYDQKKAERLLEIVSKVNAAQAERTST